MNRNKQVAKYIFFDYIAALFAWVLFFVFRKITIENGNFEDVNHVFDDSNFYIGIVFVPLFWLAVYYAQGSYKDVFRKSRLRELSQTFGVSVVGIVVIFFALLLDDYVTTYQNYYLSFLILLFTHFILTYIPRLIITSKSVNKIHARIIGFPTLIVGNQKRALHIYNELQRQTIYSGNLFIGYVSCCNDSDKPSLLPLPCLGNIRDIKNIIKTNKIEELIIALETDDEGKIYRIISSLEDISNLQIKIPAERKDILLGRVKMTAIFHTPLVLISNALMPQWQVILKRLSDIVFSILAMLILSPIYLITAIIIWTTSKGPVFYRQERIGYRGKPFYMHKFRSMYIDAEAKGIPQLSNENDNRITPFGRFMRKVRLDEIPQFYNVLCGKMSLVGPRPERAYFIDQIVGKAPEYRFLHNIKPGITSWGQVKFGYAENVDEMIERLQYDLLYLENMSLITDIKIILYTFIIVFQGRGK
ncbi:MAG: sugar transferase [Bacteroidales bacterium]|jgi:exopolysaccharide biosynthesis polyprenyl glycosylphosphotransferase|nr:sugar transferase [Bacteroidales bacterium]